MTSGLFIQMERIANTQIYLIAYPFYFYDNKKSHCIHKITIHVIITSPNLHNVFAEATKITIPYLIKLLLLYQNVVCL